MRVIPGAFMDRSVLGGIPHRLLEGMADRRFLAGGGKRGFIYILRRIHPGDRETCAGRLSRPSATAWLGQRLFRFQL